MDFAIGIENLPEYCRIDCSGSFNEGVFLHLVNLIKKDAAESGPGRRYLVDIRKTDYVLDTLGKHSLGEFAAQKLGSTRVAVLGNLEIIDKVAENTAFNRGLLALVTHLPEEAEAWVTQPR